MRIPVPPDAKVATRGRRKVPGQIPSNRNPPTLTVDVDKAPAIGFDARPMLRPEKVVDGLGIPDACADRIKRELVDLAHDSPARMRLRLYELMKHDRVERGAMKEVVRRAMRYADSRGGDQNDFETKKRRILGLRTPKESTMTTGSGEFAETNNPLQKGHAEEATMSLENWLKKAEDYASDQGMATNAFIHADGPGRVEDKDKIKDGRGPKEMSDLVTTDMVNTAGFTGDEHMASMHAKHELSQGEMTYKAAAEACDDEAKKMMAKGKEERVGSDRPVEQKDVQANEDAGNDTPPKNAEESDDKPMEYGDDMEKAKTSGEGSEYEGYTADDHKQEAGIHARAEQRSDGKERDMHADSKKQHEDKAAKLEKGGLEGWLAKAGIPGASDEGEGSAHSGKVTGSRASLDERSGTSGTAEVGRVEDGGKLAGKGTTSGSTGPMKGVQETSQVRKADTGGTDQLTPDDPNTAGALKDEMGVMAKPCKDDKGAMNNMGAAAEANPMQPAQSMTAPKSASNPQTGAAGMGESKSMGPASAGAGKPSGQAGAKASGAMAANYSAAGNGGAKSASNPSTGAAGLGESQVMNQAMHKSYEQEQALAKAQGRAKDGATDDIQLMPAPSMNRIDAPVPGAQVMAKGGAIYSNLDDLATVEFMKSQDLNKAGQPTFDLGHSERVSSCRHCDTQMHKAITVCPGCHTPRDSLVKAEAEKPTGPTINGRGMVLAKSKAGADFNAEDGLILD